MSSAAATGGSGFGADEEVAVWKSWARDSGELRVNEAAACLRAIELVKDDDN